MPFACGMDIVGPSNLNTLLSEGHGFARPENSKAFNAVAEGFLAKCLGGRAEPIAGDFAGSSISVPTGADGVPGLPEALKGHEQVIRK